MFNKKEKKKEPKKQTKNSKQAQNKKNKKKKTKVPKTVQQTIPYIYAYQNDETVFLNKNNCLF